MYQYRARYMYILYMYMCKVGCCLAMYSYAFMGFLGLTKVCNGITLYIVLVCMCVICATS